MSVVLPARILVSGARVRAVLPLGYRAQAVRFDTVDDRLRTLFLKYFAIVFHIDLI